MKIKQIINKALQKEFTIMSYTHASLCVKEIESVGSG